MYLGKKPATVHHERNIVPPEKPDFKEAGSWRRITINDSTV